MPSQKITFPGHSGAELAARLDMPDGTIRACAIFAHCFTCSKDIAAARQISGHLAAQGIAVLRFDFTGLGHSQGEFANTDFSSNIADLEAAAAFLEREHGAAQLLIGHSLGGAAVIRAATRLPLVRAVATIGAPAAPDHVTNNFGDALGKISEDGAAQVSLGGRDFCIRQEFLDDISGHNIKDALADFGKRALLVLHAPLDKVVGIENAAEIFLAAKHPKSFITLDTADHLLSRQADATYAAEVISTWARRYLELAPCPARDEAPEGVVRVREADADGFLQDIIINARHELRADEPEDFGGTDLGPSPYQLVSAGLGACTAMTMRMYARRKKMPLAHVVVDVTHNKQHASEADQSGGKVDVFRREIRMEGDLSVEDRARLMEIADKCPVHKTLHQSSQIKTVEVGETL
ncbi:MAG: bifunctional alpha/beta hydrolase/OsmC family protein [Paracoccaceae bacterium]